MAGGAAIAGSGRAKAPAPARVRPAKPARGRSEPRERATARRAAKGSKPGTKRRGGTTGSVRGRSAGSASRRSVTVAGGIVWGAALLGAAAVGPVAVAVVVIPVGFVAAVSGVRSLSRSRRGKGTTGGAAVFAAGAVSLVLPVAAVGGPVAALTVGVAMAVAVGAVLYLKSAGLAGPVMLAVFVPVAAASSLVAASEQSANLGLTLAAGVCLYDLACWVNGTGRGLGGPVGVGAGVVTVGVLAVLVAAVFVPPFTGARPWVMLGMLALLAPAGVLAGGRLGSGRAGSGRKRGTLVVSKLPAVRRLDSLIVAGPVWVVATALLLHR